MNKDFRTGFLLGLFVMALVLAALGGGAYAYREITSFDIGHDVAPIDDLKEGGTPLEQ